MTSAGIIIVGAGEAGARAAITLRGEGFAGPLVLIGEERHAPYERPPLSKATIVGEGDPAIPTIGDAGGLDALGIDLVQLFDPGQDAVQLGRQRLQPLIRFTDARKVRDLLHRRRVDGHGSTFRKVAWG